jgi:hypothetical protein
MRKRYFLGPSTGKCFNVQEIFCTIQFIKAVHNSGIKRGEYWWLEKLTEILVKTPDKIHLYERGDIATAIIYGITDPKAVPCLAQLINAPDSFLRRAAVMTLRQINSEAAIPTFIIALYDDVQDVRFYGVTGLATITKQDEYNPGVALYKENENYYLSYWRDWAQKRQK